MQAVHWRLHMLRESTRVQHLHATFVVVQYSRSVHLLAVHINGVISNVWMRSQRLVHLSLLHGLLGRHLLRREHSLSTLRSCRYILDVRQNLTDHAAASRSWLAVNYDVVLVVNLR